MATDATSNRAATSEAHVADPADDAAQFARLDTCVRCGFCLPHCPTYVLTLNERSSPRGRIALMRAVLDGELEAAEPAYVEELTFCLGCRGCETACPSGVPYGAALEHARAQAASHLAKSARERLLRRLGLRLVEGDLAGLRALAGALYLYQQSGLQWLLRRSGLLDALGLDRLDRLSPTISERFVVPTGQVWRPSLAPVIAPPHRPLSSSPHLLISSSPPRVGLFTGCIMSVAFAEVHEATVAALTANGCEVVAVTGQGCCGALHAHAGDLGGARRLARRNVDAFVRAGVDAVVVNAAGCGAALKEYAEWLGHSAPVDGFVGKVRDFSELLVELEPEPVADRRPLRGMEDRGPRTEDGRPTTTPGSAGVPPGQDDGRPGTDGGEVRAGARRRGVGEAALTTVTYQDACHLVHAQGIRRQPRQLLARVPGLALREMAESELCCGSAGIYNLTRPETAELLLDRKLDNALATGADTIVSTNPGCMLQLRSGLRRRGSSVQVRHLAEVVAASHGYQPARPRRRIRNWLLVALALAASLGVAARRRSP